MTKKGEKQAEEKLKPLKKPPKEAIKSVQMDLFRNFIANDLSEVSNTVEFWESIPKYFLNEKQQQKKREPSGLAKPFDYPYSLRNKAGELLPYKVRISPALIEQSDGNFKAFFPTKTEENIEEVLKKIFTEQNGGIHDPKNLETWVKFSYSMLRKELTRLGCGLRYDQIKHSLEIMSGCVLTVYEDSEQIYKGAILQNYCSVNRREYLNDTEALHVAQLPVFISRAINMLEYRQFNYKRFMGCGEQLTRFIYKRLINRFVNANFLNDYHFLYSDIKQGSGLLLKQNERDNRAKVISALEELKAALIIMEYHTEERRDGRSIADVKYTVKAHPDFIAEQKAANKRAQIRELKSLK